MTDNYTGLEVAIIGMALKFPGANNVEEFWKNLANGIESITFISDDELRKKNFPNEVIQNPMFVKSKGGIIDNKDLFDAIFFNYTPKEAQVLNPQSRVFHECVWQALEDSGYNPFTYEKSIGLFAGVSSGFYWEGINLVNSSENNIDHFSNNLLSNKDYFTSRISYKLNLRGPSVTLYTACSTSLVAIHNACRSLIIGDCNIAIAGGVSISCSEKLGYLYQEGMILSNDGHCRTFDREASGIVASEGIGVVVLKPLEDAMKDRDNIYAIIKSSSVNNDGSNKVGYTAPSIEGQSKVVRYALQLGNVKPENITYIEAHGTGTPLGDMVEVNALKQAFKTSKKEYCAIGSVKTNIGHLDTASGVAGLIKTVLALKFKQIPPSINFSGSNPNIDFENSPFYVNTKLSDWKRNGSPLMAGVSSFGIGGTNAHVILQEAPEINLSSESSRKWKLILLSAKTKNTLDKVTDNFLKHLQVSKDISLADLSYTLQVGRQVMPYKRCLVASTVKDAVEILSIKDNRKIKDFYSIEGEKHIVFMFSGLGSQHVNMTKELYNSESYFRAQMDFCFDYIKGNFNYDIKALLYPSNELNTSASVENFEISQLVVFISEYSLAKMLIYWGIIPNAMIGYSFGEYVCACLSGVFSFEDAINLIYWRGKLISNLPKGVMLSVPLDREKVQEYLPKELSLSIDNGLSCIVSGPEEFIVEFEKQMNVRKIMCMRITASYAIHSHMMEPILSAFSQKVNEVKLNTPNIPYISNVSGTWITDMEACSADYWIKHLRNTVEFSKGITELLKEENSIYIEIGPGQEICSLLQRFIGQSKGLIINLLPQLLRNIDDEYHIINKLGDLWLRGVNINWGKFYLDEKRRRLSLPSYPFERQRYWIDNVSIKNLNKKLSFYENNKANIDNWFYFPSWKQIPLIENKEISKSSLNQWVIFVENNDLVKGIISEIQGQAKIYLIYKCHSFKRISENEFGINPENLSDFKNLFDHISDLDKTGFKIIYTWSTYKGDVKISKEFDISTSKSLCFNSLNFLAQIINEKYHNEVIINIIVNNLFNVLGNEIIQFEKSLLIGTLKVIQQELPSIKCRLIEYDEYGCFNNYFPNFIKEIFHDVTDTTICFRERHRWVPSYEKIILPEVNNNKLPLKKHGVYIITGGLGRIGLKLAEYLVKEWEANVFLTTRYEFPSFDINGLDSTNQKRMAVVEELKKYNGSINVVKVDVCDYQAMNNMLNKVYEKFNNINGVIHCAGITKDNIIPIENINDQLINPQFKPKIDGLIVLHELFKNKDLDFLLCTSSLAPILGGLGFSIYAAANSFIDVFIRVANQNIKKKWISINWGDWQFSSFNKSDTKNIAMRPEDGIETFRRILGYFCDYQIIVSSTDLYDRINKWVQLKDLKEDVENTVVQTTMKRPNLINDYVPPQNGLEDEIVSLWKDLFGFEQIGALDNFFELGGDSLKAIIMISKVNRLVKKKITIKNVYEHPNVRGIVELINQNDAINEENFIQFNINREKKIFCFPPAIAYGLCYKNISTLVNNYSFVSFNFIEEENRLEQYYKLITKQSKGPYTFLSYSGGCMLTFEIIKFFENKGVQVADFIVLDGYIIDNAKLDRKDSNIEIYFDNIGTELHKYDFAHTAEDVMKKITNYNNYISGIQINGSIKSNVHLIVAEDSNFITKEAEIDWRHITSGIFFVHKGYGNHIQMLDKGFIEDNSIVVKDILYKIYK